MTGIPWILSASVSPLSISTKNVPPAFSGLPVNGNRDEWQEFRNNVEEEMRDNFNDYNAWMISQGGEPLYKSLPYLMNYSPYANIYMCPKELDYTDFRPNPPNWYHFEAFIRSSDEHFEIPTSLQDLPGRLIYFSMGSMGCLDARLMTRLVNILGKSPHRFIVSTGL